jgi:O-antigen chain-terminating methyltransferase
MTTPADFYRAFEDRHRGSPEAVRQRQGAYLPFLAAVRASQAGPLLEDLGCGRGEWLALAQSQGWRAQGVDTDAAMLQAARDAGLDVREADAVDFLQSLPAASCSAVTAFHVVEHLPFAKLRDLLVECSRVLAPGGLLLLETPNPENLVVGASAFHMDPTHVRPLPPALLAFAVEFAGVDRVATLRLHEGIDDSRAVELIDVLASIAETLCCSPSMCDITCNTRSRSGAAGACGTCSKAAPDSISSTRARSPACANSSRIAISRASSAATRTSRSCRS